VTSGSRNCWFHPQRRFTLRSFSLVEIRATSPWSMPSRHWSRSCSPGCVPR
jgi:hypothetical protein